MLALQNTNAVEAHDGTPRPTNGNRTARNRNYDCPTDDPLWAPLLSKNLVPDCHRVKIQLWGLSILTYSSLV